MLYCRYNPEEKKTRKHREFIVEKVRFVKIIPVHEQLQEKIHFTFRLGYLRDIHPAVLDDPMVSRITHMINLQTFHIVQHITEQVSTKPRNLLECALRFSA